MSRTNRPQSLAMLLVTIVALQLGPSAVVGASQHPPSNSASTGPDDPSGTGPANDNLGTMMTTFMDRLSAFGFHGTVLAAKNGEILVHRAYGLAQVHNNIPNQPTTLFSTGSVTKQFTATAILRLETEGKLSTSDPITKFFDDVPEDKKDITLHHLLTHTAGLRASYGDDDEPITRDELVRRILESPLVLPVGTRYEYSNGGYSMLAAIVEIVTGLEYERYLRETLFLPNGMKHTGLKLVKVDNHLLSHSHNERLGYPSPHERPEHYWHLKGNGGILSTTGDMYRWCLALQGDDLLSGEAKRKMFTGHVPEYEEGGSHYGYGWVIDKYSNDKTIIWHNGGAMPHGWSCAVYRFVEDDAVFIVFANKPMDGMHPVDRIVENLASIMVGTTPPFPPEVAAPGYGQALGHAGEYSVFDGELLNITPDGGVLRVTPEGQDIMDRLFPSPYRTHLRKYNVKTAELIDALARGDLQRATEFFDLEAADVDNWRSTMRQWWESFDSLGSYTRCDVVGTVAAGGARTYCRIHFSDGTATCRFFWMEGKCEGIMTDLELPAREFLPQTKDRYVSYSLSTGQTATLEFAAAGTCTVALGEDRFVASRRR